MKLVVFALIALGLLATWADAQCRCAKVNCPSYLHSCSDGRCCLGPCSDPSVTCLPFPPDSRCPPGHYYKCDCRCVRSTCPSYVHSCSGDRCCLGECSKADKGVTCWNLQSDARCPKNHVYKCG